MVEVIGSFDGKIHQYLLICLDAMGKTKDYGAVS